MSILKPRVLFTALLSTTEQGLYLSPLKEGNVNLVGGQRQHQHQHQHQHHHSLGAIMQLYRPIPNLNQNLQFMTSCGSACRASYHVLLLRYHLVPLDLSFSLVYGPSQREGEGIPWMGRVYAVIPSRSPLHLVRILGTHVPGLFFKPWGLEF